MFWVRYNTDTLTHNTETQGHTNKVKKAQLEYQSKKQKKAKRIIGIFQQELTWVFPKKNFSGISFISFHT